MDINNYINVDGFITIQPNANNNPGEGNGWLQTGLAIATGKYPIPTDFHALLLRCQKASYCPLIWRSPWKTNPGDETSADDYYGAMLLNYDWAASVLAYVDHLGWDFDIGALGRPKFRFDRFFGFSQFMRIAAGETLSIYDSTILALSIVWDAFSIDQADNNMKAYCKIWGTHGHSVLSDLAALFWKARVKKKYGTVGASWAAYFGHGHPLNEFDIA